MSDRFEQFIRAARAVGLTPAEKASLKLALVRRLETTRPPARSFLFAVWYRPAAAALLLLVVVGGGVSAAAQQALPGDWLYPVKIGVNENIRAALINSPAARADWRVSRINRRLAEAETLAARGALDSSASKAVTAGFERATRALETELAEAPEDSAIAASVRVDTGATFKAHRRILETVRETNEGAASEMAPLLSALESSETKLAKQSAGAISISASPSIEKKHLDATEKKVKELEHLVRDERERLSGRSAAALDRRLEAVSAALNAGQTEAASELVEETKILLRAKQRGPRLENLDLSL